MKLKALILDVDGTLADTEEAHRGAFNEAFHVHGLDWNWSRPTYAHLLKITGGKERLSAYIARLSIGLEEQRALLDRVPAIHRTKTDLYTSRVAAGTVPLREGVARLIQEARDCGVRLAIASTTTLRNIHALLLSNLGSDALSHFSVVGAGDQVARKKPAPDIYNWVLQELNESPAACVAIEDSANGIASAKAAGLYTIVTPSYWTRSEDLSGADLALPSMGSSAKPLLPLAASLVGNSVLGIREIEQQLIAVTHGHA